MILAIVDDKSWSATNTFPLVRVGDHSMVGKVDDVIQRILWSLPALTHENTVNGLLLNKLVELLFFIVDAARVDIHDGWQVEGLHEFV